MKFIVLGAMILLANSACTTTRDVLPGADGINSVELKSSDDEEGRHMAIAEAKKYCEDKQKEAVFIDNKTEYKGTMDETTKKTLKKASTAAVLIGGMAQAGSWGAGDYNNDTGKVIGGAGGVGHVMLNDNDYQTKLHFKCQ